MEDAIDGFVQTENESETRKEAVPEGGNSTFRFFTVEVALP
jgi:hypothetical protein